MITIESFQHAFLNNNSQNLLQYLFKNQFPFLKLLQRNKLNNGHSQIFSSPEFLFDGKFLSSPTTIKRILKLCKETKRKTAIILIIFDTDYSQCHTYLERKVPQVG